MNKKLMLLTLQSFSSTGGIQKMSRTLGHSLYKIAKKNNWDFKMYSAYDANADLMPQYIPANCFEGFNINRPAFALKCIKEVANGDIVILSHINLATVGLLIKQIKPECKVLLIAHGIEVWRPLSMLQKAFLKRCDKVICVSSFTMKQMIKWHGIQPADCVILNNAVDPFMKLPVNFEKPPYLLSKYNLSGNQPILFTLTRLAATEQYKGHEHVIRVINKLKKEFPGIKYILSGPCDDLEEIKLKELISANDVEEHVIITGYIAEEELTDYFLLADIFVLPSKKEGFGIVFIEALACGLPVICGNADGSTDAIRNGELGKAIDVNNIDELENAITENLQSPLNHCKRENLQKQCMQYFNEQNYMDNLQALLVNG